MKLLGNTETMITKEKNGESVPQLEITETVLVHCNIVHDQYQQSSTAMSIFVPNKSFGQLLNISSTSHIYSETFHSEF